MMPQLLSTDQITSALGQLQFNWKLEGNSLRFETTTKDFAEAAWVVAEVAKVAQELNHHPDITIQNYDQLVITSSTHSVGGVTSKDLELAEKIDAILTRIE